MEEQKKSQDILVPFCYTMATQVTGANRRLRSEVAWEFSGATWLHQSFRRGCKLGAMVCQLGAAALPCVADLDLGI